MVNRVLKIMTIIHISFLSFVSCKKEKSNIIHEDVDIKNKIEVLFDEGGRTHDKTYIGRWKLDKIRLAWLNRDSIIHENYYLHLEKKNLKYYNDNKLLFDGSVNIMINNESEVGSYLLKSNDKMFYSFDFLKDSLFIFQNSYDSDILIFKRIIKSDCR